MNIGAAVDLSACLGMMCVRAQGVQGELTQSPCQRDGVSETTIKKSLIA